MSKLNNMYLVLRMPAELELEKSKPIFGHLFAKESTSKMETSFTSK